MSFDPDALTNVVLTVVVLTGLGLVLSAAHVGERERLVRIVVQLLLAALDGLLVLAGAAYLLAGRVLATDAGSAPLPLGLQDALVPLGGVLLLAGVAGLLTLLPPVRRLLAHLIPIDPARIVHAAALHYAYLTVVLATAVAIVLSGLLDDPEGLEMLSDQTAAAGLSGLWAQAVGFVIVSALGVGLLTSRRPAEVLSRLGLTRAFDWRWWVGASLAGLAGSYATDLIWQATSPESLAEVERLSEALFGPLIEHGLAGALTIGLSAGIGEELLFRGAAQPRLGLVLTSLLFAAVHTQYTVSPALVQVLLIGLLLGLTRRHANTTTAIGVHATYNFVLVMLALYAPETAP